MRLGVLDVGSNTVHLIVVDAHPGARPVPMADHKSVLRLMRYLEPDGAISAEGVAAIVDAISAAVAVAEREGIDELLPMATSALREARNGEEVLALIEQRTGVALRVLTGEDEGRLTFLAIRRWYGWSSGTMLLFDIGGGSLEIAQGVDEFPDVAVSLPLGAGRTTVQFFPEDPPTPEQMLELRAYSRQVMRADALPLFEGLPPVEHVVGSSKTIRSLARLAGSSFATSSGDDRLTLRRSELKDWIPRLGQINAEARQALPGITPDRTFQIVAGAIVLHSAMKLYDVELLEVSPWALREGILLRYLDGLDR
ncbi:Ppx/GppA family phosphatase [Herbiconiux moechotypicola]|uniref:Ppx/GppA phosphatase family protein n=1 Tax=Herbiconiux moechotypicola TaxID=637393 RepID=A0ABN3DQA1_9MICO|nr:Ppx/GppA family phosphatase [Herbiconiux moechotypicola]MCS5731715.1 Ppx/GppA family phosphatase [Herbiconiux moechotypicola]